jgi:methyl-accepting chemotaxis protein
MRSLHRWTISVKIVGMAAVIVVAAVALNTWMIAGGARDASIRAVEREAAAITAVAEHMGAINTSQDSVEGAPVCGIGAWLDARAAVERDGLRIGVVGFESLDSRDGGSDGGFRSRMFSELRDSMRTSGDGTLTRVDHETNSLHFMRAIRGAHSCNECRSVTGMRDGLSVATSAVHPTSAASGDLDLRPGEIAGAFEVIVPLAVIDEQAAIRSWTVAAWAMVVAGAGVGIFAIVLRRIMGTRLRVLVETVEALERGELTRRGSIAGSDEIGRIGRGLRLISMRLRASVAEVAGVTREVAAVSARLTSMEPADGTAASNTSADRARLAAVMSEISSGLSVLAKTGQKACVAASEYASAGSESAAVIERASAEIMEVKESAAPSKASVAAIGERGDCIAQLATLIGELSDQTNLLALNAAIEAARAGDDGRGFAMVAQEVRRQAELTTRASEEVTIAINELRREASIIVEGIEAARERIDNGAAVLGTASEAATRIVGSSHAAADVVRSIASEVEARGVTADELARSLGACIANERSSEVESERALAAAVLCEQSEKLQSLIARFRL